MSKNERPDIDQFENYMDFAKAMYKWNKIRAISERQMAKDGGFGSPNYVKMVIDGKRNLASRRAAEGLAKALRFTEIETHMFLSFAQTAHIERLNKDWFSTQEV